jgi:ribokinase
MSRLLNFGSLCIDNVYTVGDFARPGETVASLGYQMFAGGKGLNQSIAASKAGAQVYHAGRIGHDGLWMKELMAAAGVDVERVLVDEESASGHAVIQVNAAGENAIVITGGANRRIGSDDIADGLAGFGAGDLILLQNEINRLDEIMECAARNGLRIVFNAAPMDEGIGVYPLEQVGTLIVNELEAAGLCGEVEPARALSALRERFPQAAIVLTLGADGVIYADAATRLAVSGHPVQSVDGTGAGDTFIGYYLAEMMRSGDVESALRLANAAGAICVTRPGAAASIPEPHEVFAFLGEERPR